MVLVIPGHLLDQNTTAYILEDDEVPDQIQKPALLEHALKNHLKLRQPSVCKFFTLDGAPGHEPLAVSRQGADSRLHAVRDHHRFVE